MIRKTLFHCMLAGLFLASLGMIGCSDDTQRLVTGPEPVVVDQLTTDTDWPGLGDDVVTGGYDFSGETDDAVVNDLLNPEDQNGDDVTNRKPLDNGRG